MLRYVSNVSMNNSNYSDMFNVAVQSQQDIVNTTAEFLSKVVFSKFLSDDNGNITMIDNNTLKYQSMFNICKAGYQPDKNGFLCGETYL